MNVFAKFYDRMVKTDDINEKTGLPIFKEVCFVEIRIKNNATDVVDQPATEEKIRRFPAEYQLYLQGKEKEKKGTSLSLFAFLTVSEQETLRSRGIFTLEDFVSLPKNKVDSLNLVEEHKKAKSFMKLHKNQVVVNSLTAQINALKQENARLKEALEEKNTVATKGE